MLLQLLVVYAPFLQPAFGTVGLGIRDWFLCVAVASSVLWLLEPSKVLSRMYRERSVVSRRGDRGTE